MIVGFRVPTIFCKLLNIKANNRVTRTSDLGDEASQRSPSPYSKEASPPLSRYLLNDDINTVFTVITTSFTMRTTGDNPVLRGHPAFYEYTQFILIPVRLLAIDTVSSFALITLVETNSSTDPSLHTRSFVKVPLQLVQLDCYATLQDEKDARYTNNLHNNGLYSPYEQAAKYLVDSMFGVTTPSTLETLHSRSDANLFIKNNTQITYLKHRSYNFIRFAVIDAACLLWSFHSFSKSYTFTHLQARHFHFDIEPPDTFNKDSSFPQHAKQCALTLICPQTLQMLLANDRELLHSLLTSRSAEDFTPGEKATLLTGNLYNVTSQRLLLRLCKRLPDGIENIITEYCTFYSQAISFTIMRLCTINNESEETRIVESRDTYDLGKLALVLTDLIELLSFEQAFRNPQSVTDLTDDVETLRLSVNSLTLDYPQYDSSQISNEQVHAFYMKCLHHGIVPYSRETRRIFHSIVNRCARGSTTFSFYSSGPLPSTRGHFKTQHTALLSLARYSPMFLQLSNKFLQYISSFCGPINLSVSALLDGLSSSKRILQQYNQLFQQLEIQYKEIGYNFVSIKRKIYTILKEESSETRSLLQSLSAFPNTVDFLLDPLILSLVRRRSLQSPYIYVEKYIYQQIHLESPHIYYALDVVSDEEDEDNTPTLQVGDEEKNPTLDREAKKTLMKTVLEQHSGSTHADFFYDTDLNNDQYSDTLRYALLYSKLFSVFITDFVPLISALFFREFCIGEPGNNRKLSNSSVYNPILAYEMFTFELVVFLQRTFSEDLDSLQVQLLHICTDDHTNEESTTAENALAQSSIEALITAQNVSTIKPNREPFISLDFVCLKKADVSKPYQRGEDTKGISNLTVSFTADCIAQIVMLRTVVTNIIYGLYRLTPHLKESINSYLTFLTKKIVPGYSELPSIKKYCKRLVQKELELIQADLTSFNILYPKCFQDRIQREVYLEDIINSRYTDFEKAYFEERKNLRLKYAQLLANNFTAISNLENMIEQYPPTPMGAKINMVIVPCNKQFFQKFDRILSNIYSMASLCIENITLEFSKNNLHVKAMNSVLRYQYLTANEDSERLERIITEINTTGTNTALPDAIFFPPSFLYRKTVIKAVEEQVDMTNVLNAEIINFTNPLFSVKLTNGLFLKSYGLCDASEMAIVNHATLQSEEEEKSVASDQKIPSENPDSNSTTITTQKQTSGMDFPASEFQFLHKSKTTQGKQSPEKRYRDISMLYLITDNSVLIVRKIISYIRHEIMTINPQFYTSILVYDTQLMKRQLINKLIAIIKNVREHVRQTINEVLQVPFAAISFFETRICLDMDTPENLDKVIMGLGDTRRFIHEWIPVVTMLIDMLPLLSYLESTASITDIQSLFEYLRISDELRQTSSSNTAQYNEQGGQSNDDSDSEDSTNKKVITNEHADRIRDEISADFEYATKDVPIEIENALHERRVHKFLLTRDLLFVAEDQITLQQMLDHAFDTQLLARIDRDRVKYERRKARYLRRIAAEKGDHDKMSLKQAVSHRVTLPKVSVLVSMRLSQLRIYQYSYGYPIITLVTRILNLRRLINICKGNIDRRLQSFSHFIYLSVEYLLYLRQLCIGLSNEVMRLNALDIISSVAQPLEFKAKYPHLTSTIVLNRLEQYFKSQNSEEAYAFIRFIQSHTSLSITRFSSSQRHIISLYVRPSDEYLCKNPLVTDLESFFRFLVKCICESDEDGRTGTIKRGRDADGASVKKLIEQKQAENTSPYYDIYAILSEVHTIAKESIKIFKAISQWSDILGITLAIEDPSFQDLLNTIESPCQLVVSIVDMFVSYVRIMNQPVTAFNPSLFIKYLDTVFSTSRAIYINERSNSSATSHIMYRNSAQAAQSYNSEYSYHRSSVVRLINDETTEFFINEDYNICQSILEESIFMSDDTTCDNGRSLTTNITIPHHEQLLSKGIQELNLPTSEAITRSNKFVIKGMEFVLSLIDGEKISAGYALRKADHTNSIELETPLPKSDVVPSLMIETNLKQGLSVVQEESIGVTNVHAELVFSMSDVPKQNENLLQESLDNSQSQATQIIMFDEDIIKNLHHISEENELEKYDPMSEISAAQPRVQLHIGEISTNSFSVEHNTLTKRHTSSPHLNKGLISGDTTKLHPSFTVVTGMKLAISLASRTSPFILNNSVRDANVYTTDKNTGLQSLREIAMKMNVIKTPAKTKYFTKAYIKKKDIRTTIRAKDNSADVISAKILETINSFKHTALFEDQRLESSFTTWIPTIRSLIVSLILYSVQHFSFLAAVRLIFNSNYFVSYFLTRCLENARASDEPSNMSFNWQNPAFYSSISIKNTIELINPLNYQLAIQVNKQYLINYSLESKLLEIYYWIHNIDIFLTYYTINLHLNDDIARLLSSIDFGFGEMDRLNSKEDIAKEQAGQTTESLQIQKQSSSVKDFKITTEASVDNMDSDPESTSRASSANTDDQETSNEDSLGILETPFGRIESSVIRRGNVFLSKPLNKVLTIVTPHVPAPSLASKVQGAASSQKHRNAHLTLLTSKAPTKDLASAHVSQPVLLSSAPRARSKAFQPLLPERPRKKVPIIRKRRSYDGPSRVILPFFSTHQYLLKALREALFVVTVILANPEVIPNVKSMARVLEEKLILCQNFVISLANARKLLPELISLSNAIYDGIPDLALLRVSLNDIKKVTIEIISCLKYLCLTVKSRHEVIMGFTSTTNTDQNEDENAYTIPFTSFLDNLNLLDRRRCGTRFTIPKFFREEAPNPNSCRFISLLTRSSFSKVSSFITNINLAEALLLQCRQNISAYPVITTIYTNHQYRICAPYARLPHVFSILYSELTAATYNHILPDELLNSDFSPLITKNDDGDLSRDDVDAGIDDQEQDPNIVGGLVMHNPFNSQLSYSLLANTIDTTGHFFGLHKGHENIFYQMILKSNARIKDCYLFTDGSLHSQHLIHEYRKAMLLFLNERYYDALIFCTYQAFVYALSCTITLYCNGSPEAFIYCYENVICTLLQIIENDFYELVKGTAKMKTQSSFQVGSTSTSMWSKVLMIKSIYTRLLEHKTTMGLMALTVIHYLITSGLPFSYQIPAITNDFDVRNYWEILLVYGRDSSIVLTGAKQGCSLSITTNKYTSLLIYSLTSDTLLSNGANRRIDIPILDLEYTPEDKLLIKNARARTLRTSELEESNRLAYSKADKIDERTDSLLSDDFHIFCQRTFTNSASFSKSIKPTLLSTDLDDTMAYKTPVSSVILNCDFNTADFRMPVTHLSENLVNIALSGETISISASYFNPANEYDTVYMSYFLQHKTAQLVAALRGKSVVFLITDMARGYRVPEVYYLVHLVGRVLSSHVSIMAITNENFRLQYGRLRELLISRYIVLLYGVEQLSHEHINAIASLFMTETLSYGFENGSTYSICSDMKLEFIASKTTKATGSSQGWIPIHDNVDHSFCRLIVWLSSALPHDHNRDGVVKQAPDVATIFQSVDEYYSYQLHPTGECVLNVFRKAYVLYLPIIPYFSIIQTTREFTPNHLTCASVDSNDRNAVTINFAEYRKATLNIFREQFELLISQVTLVHNRKLGDSCHASPPFKQCLSYLSSSLSASTKDSFYQLYVFLNQLSTEFPRFLPLDVLLIQRRLSSTARSVDICTQTFVYLLSYIHLMFTDTSHTWGEASMTAQLSGYDAYSDYTNMALSKLNASAAHPSFYNKATMLTACLSSIFGLSANEQAFFKHSVSQITAESVANLIRSSSSAEYCRAITTLQKSIQILSEFGIYAVTVISDLLVANEAFVILTTTMARQFFEHLKSIFSKITSIIFLIAHSSEDIYVYLDMLLNYPNRYAIVLVLDQHSDSLFYQNVLGLLGSRQVVSFDNNQSCALKVRVRVILVARTLDMRISRLSIRKFYFNRVLHVSDTNFYRMSFGSISDLNLDHLDSIRNPTLTCIPTHDKIAHYIYSHFDIDFFSYTNSALTKTKLGLYISYFNFLVLSFIKLMSKEVSARSILTQRQWQVIKALVHIFLRYYGIIEIETTNSVSSVVKQEENAVVDSMNPYHEISLRSNIDPTNPISMKQQKELRNLSHQPLEFTLHDALAPQFLTLNENVAFPAQSGGTADGSLKLESFESSHSTGSNKTFVQFTQSFISRLFLTSNSRAIVDILHYSVISSVLSAFTLLYRMEYTSRGLAPNDFQGYKMYKAVINYIPVLAMELEDSFFGQHIFYNESGFRLNKWMQLFCDNAIASLQDFYVSQTFFFVRTSNQCTGLELSQRKRTNATECSAHQSPVSSPKKSMLCRSQLSMSGDHLKDCPPDSLSNSLTQPVMQTAVPDSPMNKYGVRQLWKEDTHSFLAITSYLSDKLLLSIARKLKLTVQLINEIEQSTLPQYRKRCMDMFNKGAEQMNRSRVRGVNLDSSIGVPNAKGHKLQRNRKLKIWDISHQSNAPGWQSSQVDVTNLYGVSSSGSVLPSFKRVSNKILTSIEKARNQKISQPLSTTSTQQDTNLSNTTTKRTGRARLDKLKSLQLSTTQEDSKASSDKELIAFIRRYIPVIEIPYKINEELFFSNSLHSMQANYADTSNSLQLIITSEISAYAVYYAGCMLSETSFAVIGDAFSGKTTALRLAASLLGSNQVDFKTFQVGTSSIRKVTDLYIEILRQIYTIKPETSQSGNMYSARSLSGQFTVLHVTGITSDNLLEFLIPQLLEHTIYISPSQSAISRAIGGFYGHIFLYDCIVVYEISSSHIQETLNILNRMSITVSNYSATAKPVFLNSLVYRNFVYNHLIQESYYSAEQTMLGTYADHYNIDDPFTAMSQIGSGFLGPKTVKSITARVLAAKGVKRFPKLSAEAVASNISAHNNDSQQQLVKYSPMSIVIRTLVRSFTEGLLLIKNLLPVSLMELLCTMKDITYFDDTDTRNVFGYPPSNYLDNLHLLVPSANILFSALLRHGSIPTEVSTYVYKEFVSAFSTGTLAKTSVFGVLIPEYAQSFKRMYPFLVPFSYSGSGASETISIMIHFTWEQYLEAVIGTENTGTQEDSQREGDLPDPLQSANPSSEKEPAPKQPTPTVNTLLSAEDTPTMVIFGGDYSTRHKIELHRKYPIEKRKDFRFNKVLNIDRIYSTNSLKFTAELIDELSTDQNEININEPQPIVVNQPEKTQKKSTAENNMKISMLGKLSRLQDPHLVSMLNRVDLDFSDSDDASDYTEESLDYTDHDASHGSNSSVSMSNMPCKNMPHKQPTSSTHITYSDYAQSFKKSEAKLNEQHQQDQEETSTHNQLMRTREKRQPSTTIVRLLVKYRHAQRALQISVHVVMIIIQAYLSTEIVWQRNCLKVYEYLSSLRYGPAGGLTKFEQFSKTYNPPNFSLSYLKVEDVDDYVNFTHRLLQLFALLGNFKLVNSLDFLGFNSDTYYSPHEGNVRVYKENHRKSIKAIYLQGKEKVTRIQETSVPLLSVHQALHTNFKVHLLFTRYHRYLINSYQLLSMVGLLALDVDFDNIEESLRKALKPVETSYYEESSDEDDFLARTNPRILRTLQKKSVYTPDLRPLLRNEKPVMTYSGKLSRTDLYYYIFKEYRSYCVEKEPFAGFSLPLNGLRIDFLLELVALYRKHKDISVLTYYIIRACILMALGFNPSLGLKDLSVIKIREFYLSTTTSGMELWGLIDPALVKKHLNRKSIREFFLPEPTDILLVLHSNLFIGKMDILSILTTLKDKLTAVFSREELRFISLLVGCYYDLNFLLCEGELLWLLSRNLSILLINNTNKSLPLSMQNQFYILPSIVDQVIRKHLLENTPIKKPCNASTLFLSGRYLENLEKSLKLIVSSVAEPLLRRFSIINLHYSLPIVPAANSFEEKVPGSDMPSTDTLFSFKSNLMLACTIGYSTCIRNVRPNMLMYTLKFTTYIEHVWHFCYLRMRIYTSFALSLHKIIHHLKSPIFQNTHNIQSVLKEAAMSQPRFGILQQEKTTTLMTIPEKSVLQEGVHDLPINPILNDPRNGPGGGSLKDPMVEPILPKGILGTLSSRMTDISRKSRSVAKLSSDGFYVQIKDLMVIVDRLMSDVSKIIHSVIIDSVVTVSSLVFKHQLIPTIQYDDIIEALIVDAAIDAGLVNKTNRTTHSTPSEIFLAHIGKAADAYQESRQRQKTSNSGKTDATTFLMRLFIEMKTAQIRLSTTLALDTFQVNLPLLLRYADLALEMRFGISQSTAARMRFLKTAHKTLFYRETIHAFLCYILFTKVQTKFPILSPSLFIPIIYMSETLHHIEETKILLHADSASQIKSAYKFEFLDCSLQHDEFISQLHVILSCSDASTRPLCLYNMFLPSCSENNRSLTRLLRAFFMLLKSPLPVPDEFGVRKPFVTSLHLDDAVRVSLTYHPRTRRIYMCLADPYDSSYLLEFSHQIFIISSPVTSLQYYIGTEYQGNIDSKEHKLSTKESSMVTKFQHYRQRIVYDFIVEMFTIIFMYETIHFNLPLTRIGSALISKNSIISGMDAFNDYIESIAQTSLHLSAEAIEVVLTYIRHLQTSVKKLDEFVTIVPSIKQGIDKHAKTFLLIYELMWKLSQKVESLSILFTDAFFSDILDAVIIDLKGTDHYALHRRRTLPKSSSDRRMVELLPAFMYRLLLQISVLIPQRYIQPILGVIACIGFVCGQANTSDHIALLSKMLKMDTSSLASESLHLERRKESSIIDTRANFFSEWQNKLYSLLNIPSLPVREWITFFETHRQLFLKYYRGPSFLRAVVGYYAYIEWAPKTLRKANAAAFLTRYDVYKCIAHEYSTAEAFGGFTPETGIVPAWCNTVKRGYYGSGTIKIKGPLTNTHPGEYNSYKIQDKKEVGINSESSSDESVRSLDEDDCDAMFDYDYADSDQGSSAATKATASNPPRQPIFYDRSIITLLGRTSVEPLSLTLSPTKELNLDKSTASVDDKDSGIRIADKLIPDELVADLKEHMLMGNYPASITTPSSEGIWGAFLLSICFNPENLMEDVSILSKVNRLTKTYINAQSKLLKNQRDHELLSKALQCPPGLLDDMLNIFISTFYKSQLAVAELESGDQPSYEMFYDDDGEPLPSKSKWAILDSASSAASKTVMIFYDKKLDVLNLVSFALNYLVEPLLLTAPVIYKATPSHNDLLSHTVVALSNGNTSIKWLLQLFMTRPVKPKHGLIVLIPISNEAPTLSKLIVSYFYNAFCPVIAVFNAPTNPRAKLKHHFTLLRMLQLRHAIQNSVEVQLPLANQWLKLPIIPDNTLVGLFLLLSVQKCDIASKFSAIRISDAYTHTDTLMLSLFDMFLRTEQIQALKYTLQTRLRAHPTSIEKIYKLYSAIYSTIASIQRFDAERAMHHPLNRRLKELSDQLLLAYARTFNKQSRFSSYGKFSIDPGLLLHAHFLKECILSLCHEYQTELTLGHHIIVGMPKATTIKSVLAVETCVENSSEESSEADHFTEVTEESTCVDNDLSNKASTAHDMESSVHFSAAETVLGYKIEDVSSTKQKNKLDNSQAQTGDTNKGDTIESIKTTPLFVEDLHKKPNYHYIKESNSVRYDIASTDRLALKDGSHELRIFAPSDRLVSLYRMLMLPRSESGAVQKDSDGTRAMITIDSYIMETKGLLQDDHTFHAHMQGAIQLMGLMEEEGTGDAAAFMELCEEYLYQLELYTDENTLPTSQYASLIGNGEIVECNMQHEASSSLDYEEIPVAPSVRTTAFISLKDINDRLSISPHKALNSYGQIIYKPEGYIMEALLVNSIQAAQPIPRLASAINDHKGILVCDASLCWALLNFILTVKRHHYASQFHVSYNSLWTILLPHPPRHGDTYALHNGILYSGNSSREATKDRSKEESISMLDYVHIKNLELHNISYDAYNNCAVDCSLDSWPVVHRISAYAITVLKPQSSDICWTHLRQMSPRYVAVRASFAPGVFLYLENKSKLSTTELAKRNLHLSPVFRA